MTTSIPAVAFGFNNPEAIRIVLQFRGNYNFCWASDLEQMEKLSAKDKERNIVVLPNFTKRHELIPYADRIGYLILLAQGRHAEIAEHNVPFLDAVFVDGEFRADRARTPTYFMKKIPEAAVELDLGEAAPVEKARVAKSKKLPSSILHWLEVLEQSAAQPKNFSVDVEQPVALYVVGQLARKEFKAALRAAMRSGVDRELIHKFYKWMSEERAQSYISAMKAYLWPKKIDKAPSALRVAKHFDVAAVDVELIERIYVALEQGDQDVEEEQEAEEPRPATRSKASRGKRR